MLNVGYPRLNRGSRHSGALLILWYSICNGEHRISSGAISWLVNKIWGASWGYGRHLVWFP